MYITNRSDDCNTRCRCEVTCFLISVAGSDFRSMPSHTHVSIGLVSNLSATSVLASCYSKKLGKVSQCHIHTENRRRLSEPKTTRTARGRLDLHISQGRRTSAYSCLFSCYNVDECKCTLTSIDITKSTHAHTYLAMYLFIVTYLRTHVRIYVHTYTRHLFCFIAKIQPRLSVSLFNN